MFRILIVDDERIILNGIRRMIQEELQLSFETDIVTASNALQALELLKHFQPDLILTDIRMPVMDGFELIRRVREQMPAVNIVILTSHADFEYARQGIRYQVADFILKPIEVQMLKEVICQAYHVKEEKEQAYLRAALLEVRNMMLYDLSAQELTSAPELIGQLFSYTYFTVIVLALSKAEETYGMLLEKILLRYYNHCYCFFLQERCQWIAICNHEQFLTKPADLNQEFFRESSCEEFWTGISISAVSYKTLHNLYQNAVQRIFYTRHFGESSDLTEISLFTYQDCVRIFLENDEEAALQLLQKYLIGVRAADLQENKPEMIYQSFFHNILLYLENSNITVSADLISWECRATDQQELVSEIMAQLGILKQRVQKNQDRYGSDALSKQLLEYIRQHYQEDVSLDDLAAHVRMHPNYVCTVFKKNIGQSYLACLHQERLRAAKELLSDTDYTMERIAAEVGYNSASQLARVFRKYENLSPSEFRSFGDAKG